MTPAALETDDGLLPGYYTDDGRFVDLSGHHWHRNEDGTWSPDE